ncbi:MAG: hypothetical protein D6722_14155 [Bacteroidetes bacterium]|nr:MAG: hypothetical protein D6722_14155 [Bacteroidota bacterium]
MVWTDISDLKIFEEEGRLAMGTCPTVMSLVRQRHGMEAGIERLSMGSTDTLMIHFLAFDRMCLGGEGYWKRKVSSF